MVREEDVKEHLSRYMQRRRYKVQHYREKRQQGSDLVFAYDGNGRTISVEAKGETGAKSEKETKIRSALGQIMNRFVSGSPRTRILGIAVPEDWRQRLMGKLSREKMVDWNLRLYFISEHGRVSEVTQRTFNAVYSQRAQSRSRGRS